MHIALCATHSSLFFTMGPLVFNENINCRAFFFPPTYPLPLLLDHQLCYQFCLYHAKSPFFIFLHALFCSQLSSSVNIPSPTLPKPVKKIKLLAMISL